jgi:ketosteroid isomerase-like protein
VNGTLWIGKKDIEDRHANARIFKSSHAEIKPDSVRLLRPDTALVHASWTITGDPRDPQPRSYLMTMVVSKRDGHWLIVAAQNRSPVCRSTLPGTTVLAPSPLPKAPDADQTPSDVRKLLAEADKDWNQNYAKAVASLFADHADLVDTSARRFSGRDDIEKHIANVLAHQFQGTTSRTTILTSTTLGPDLAFSKSSGSC